MKDTLFCDLHFHTHFSSDAYNDPKIILPIMQRSGIRIIAPTDHDALEANAVFAQMSAAYDIRIITGVELDTNHPDLGSLHILGYGFDPSDSGIIAFCDREQAAGQHFFNLTLKAMISDGYMDSIEEFTTWAHGHRPQGRLGMKQAWKWLVKCRGFSVDSAKQYVNDTVTRNVDDHICPHPSEAIEIIRRAGGVAVLAHPAHLQQNPDHIKKIIDTILELGAIGIETYTPSNMTEANIELIANLGRTRGALVTGGSDCHSTDETVPTVWPSMAPIQCGEDLLFRLRSEPRP